MDIYTLLSHSIDIGASDIHLAVGTPPVLRINGELQLTNFSCIDKSTIDQLLIATMTAAQHDLLLKKYDVDYAYESPNGTRLRVSAYQTHRGINACFRIIPQTIMPLRELYLDPIHIALLHKLQGLILITGPTGCGKSSTLASMINHINHTQAKHIITVEDPIEYLYQNQRSLISQREIGKTTASFHHALRAALRADPDIILIGEMRDAETIHLALQAAETGHLVLSTLHTNSAAESIERILQEYNATQQDLIRSLLANTLLMVLSQRLIKRTEPATGRTIVHEIMIGTPAVRHLIREHKIAQLYSVLQTGHKEGMHTLEQHTKLLMRQGVISASLADLSQ